MNVISAYAPQVDYEESQKEEFWRKIDEVIQRIRGSKDILIGGDMNGPEGNDKTVYERVHGWYSFGIRNEAVERILDFSLAYNLTDIDEVERSIRCFVC